MDEKKHKVYIMENNNNLENINNDMGYRIIRVCLKLSGKQDLISDNKKYISTIINRLINCKD